MNIGIFGGTFDPIHNGHLSVLEEVQKFLTFTEIQVVPCFQSPFKKRTTTSDSDRLTMLKLALEDFPLLKINSYEIEKKEISYSIDTILHFQKIYGEKTELYFIMSMDSFAQFYHWKNYQEILAKCHLVVLNRSGFNFNENYVHFLDFTKVLKKENHLVIYQNKKKLFFINTQTKHVSSSEIRQLLEENKLSQLKTLLPKKVLSFILANNLYRK